MPAIYGMINAIEVMTKQGWKLVRKDFTKNGRHGVDLVFKQKSLKNSVIHATVEAKGYSKASHFFKPTPYGDFPGSPAYTERVLREAALNGNSRAKYLLKRVMSGKVQHITQFMDGRIIW